MRFLTASTAILILLGAGCRSVSTFVKAPETTPVAVSPSVEGGAASTGGQSTTVTPILATEILVSALPASNEQWAASEAVEQRNPIPLPDGTRGEYAAVAREYTLNNGRDIAQKIKVSLTDTRGIPALTTFLDSYSERADDGGYRSHINVSNQPAWITYSFGPNLDKDGTGSVTLLYRDRFLIQVDGDPGISSDTLKQLTEAFQWDALK